jgi:sugar/nucleoside kinase (ribokinase family)
VFDVVSVGHISIDSIRLPERNRPFIVLGGSVAYASLAARRLGARAAVVSKVGGDFPNAYKTWLMKESVDVSAVSEVENARTTRFELVYSSDLSDRVLRLRARAPPILADELPNSLEAEAVHLAPIAHEIGFEVAERLRKSASVLSLDPQGLVREFSKDGHVTLGPLVDGRILGLVDIFKSSAAEIGAVTGVSELRSAMKSVHERGVKIVIVTLGKGGVMVSTEGESFSVPTFKHRKVVDPTGAGDVFIGAFLAEYTRSEDYFWCSCVGSATSSLVVEGVGPALLGEKKEIYRRARVLYEKEIKE